MQDVISLCNDIHLTVNLLKKCDRFVSDVNLTTFVSIRSVSLLEKLSHLTNQANSSSFGNASYIKGTSPFLQYSDTLFKSMKSEREFVNKLFTKSQAIAAFQGTSSPAIEAYLESAETVLGRFKRSFASVEESVLNGDDLFQLLDVVYRKPSHPLDSRNGRALQRV